MKTNPANAIKDTMWAFLMDKGQKANPEALKEAVYDLISMTTQKTAGQRKTKKDIDWDSLDMTLMTIVIEATALVLSGALENVQDVRKNFIEHLTDNSGMFDSEGCAYFVPSLYDILEFFDDAVEGSTVGKRR